MQLATCQVEKAFILYDADALCDGALSNDANSIDDVNNGALIALDRPAPSWFTPDFWRARGAVIGEAPGRGASLFIQVGSRQWVLRPYRRGGMIARLSEADYLWTGLERSRAFRELRLTATLLEQDLPVPRPIAACVWHHGLTYRAALITERLAGATALASRLDQADENLLEKVGEMIQRFHAAGLDHVDLNARNILLDKDDRPWLIDLDRCRLRSPGAWREANLQRLARSLAKFDSPGAIDAIRAGYARGGAGG